MRKLITILFILLSFSAISQKTRTEYGLKSIFTPTINSYEYKLNGVNINNYYKLSADTVNLSGYATVFDLSSYGKWTIKNDSTIYFNTVHLDMIGIGTNTPIYPLQVTGNIFSSNLKSLPNKSTSVGSSAGYYTDEVDETPLYNVFVGQESGFHGAEGHDNTMIGYMSGFDNTTGNHNTIIGSTAGANITGSNNVVIGSASAFFSSAVSNNIIIGYGAGRYLTKSHRLLINDIPTTTEYTDTTQALIYGNFTTNQLTVNGTIRATGDAYFELPHVALYRSTDLTISATQNVWYKLSGMTTKYAPSGINVVSDSCQLVKKGHYIIILSMSFSGLNNEVWEYGTFKNGALDLPSKKRYTGTPDVGDVTVPIEVYSDGNDWFSFKIRNTTDNDDPTIKSISIIISTVHLIP